LRKPTGSPYLEPGNQDDLGSDGIDDTAILIVVEQQIDKLGDLQVSDRQNYVRLLTEASVASIFN
jgi:hypothetical protein